MKKFGLFVVALAAIAVLGTSAYAAGKMGPKAKLMTAKGTITAVDVKALTFTLKEEAGTEMTFTVSAKLAKALKVDEKVTVDYKILANGNNQAVYVNKVKVKKAAPAK